MLSEDWYNRSAPHANRVSAKLRCAIYTRKSSEEGLEQDFNSLDAQREACEAFILSQKREDGSLSAKFMTTGVSRAPGWNGRPSTGCCRM
jgi:DNA invertase Pin-like site-specific DNA recombinase